MHDIMTHHSYIPSHDPPLEFEHHEVQLLDHCEEETLSWQQMMESDTRAVHIFHLYGKGRVWKV